MLFFNNLFKHCSLSTDFFFFLYILGFILILTNRHTENKCNNFLPRTHTLHYACRVHWCTVEWVGGVVVYFMVGMATAAWVWSTSDSRHNWVTVFVCV